VIEFTASLVSMDVIGVIIAISGEIADKTSSVHTSYLPCDATVIMSAFGKAELWSIAVRFSIVTSLMNRIHLSDTLICTIIE